MASDAAMSMTFCLAEMKLHKPKNLALVLWSETASLTVESICLKVLMV